MPSLGLGSSVKSEIDKYHRIYSSKTLQFDGPDDPTKVLNFGNIHNLSDTDFSISVWFKRADKDTDYYFLGKQQNADNRWMMYCLDDDKVAFMAATSRTKRIEYITSATAIPDNTGWNHVLISVDRDDASASGMWINGSAVTLATETESGIAVDIDNTGDFSIGEVTGGNELSGYIDDVSFWNVPMAGQIAKIRGGSTGQGNGIPMDLSGRTGLVAWYRMGDGSIDDVNSGGDGIVADQQAKYLANEYTIANALAKGSSEADATTGWTNSGMATFESSDVTDSEQSTGKYSIHCVANSNGDYITATHTITSGKTYKVSVLYKVANGDGGSTFYMIGDDNAAGGTDYFTTPVLNSTSWAKATAYFRATGSTLYLSFKELGGDDDVDFYVDDLSIEEVNTTSVGYIKVATAGFSTGSAS